MVLKRVYIVGLILFASGLFSARAAAPARLPLLPLPQAAAAEADPGVAAEYGRIEIRKEGVADSLTAAVEEELAALAVSGAGGTFVVECRVTEKASSLRRALKGAGETFLAPYADSIGTQGYLLSFDRDRASLTARTPRGIYYGLQSVKQLLRDGWSGRAKVADWPDMPVRVFFDDISRGPLSNLGEVKRQIRQLAEWKYTDLTFYIEHIVKVPSYPDFAPVNGHFTMEEVREICRYAARYNMEVIGGFQSFGHFENILALPRYAPMGETPSLISPLDPEARRFLKAVLEELSDNFSSKYFNVNCDETWDLAKGRSREYVARVGADRFYADHVRFLYDVLKAKGKTMMLWGDIVMKYPHLIKELPRDVVYLPWNYSDLPDFRAWIEPFAREKAHFMVCPGIVTALRTIPEMQVVRENMRFIREGYAAGAEGAILTSWDDGALHNFGAMTYGIALGGETMWNVGETAPKEEFDARFERNRYGRSDAGFVRAMDKLLELTRIGITYQMNNKVFDDRFVPEPGGEVSVNLGQWARVDSVLREAEALAARIRVERNEFDVETFGYTLGQYRFLVDSRQGVARIAGAYGKAAERAASDPEGARAELVALLPRVEEIARQAARLEELYTRLWLTENQSYFLDRGLAGYADKRKQIGRLRDCIVGAVNAIDSDGKPASARECGLVVRDINSDYFGTWLFCGTFTDDIDDDPLAPVGGELKADPIPGERFQIGDKGYIWTRTISPNGFTMDFNQRYNSDQNALAYATAVIISPEAQEVTALFGCSGEAEVILNGERVFRSGRELEFTADKYSVPLKLKEGNNRLIVKSKQLVNEWKFSLRIDGREIQAHKQKYRIQ